MLQLAVANLDEPEASNAAAHSIQDLCDSCGHLMAGCLDSLVELFHRVMPMGVAVGLDGQQPKPAGVILREEGVHDVSGW